jgi:hypothetical protein
MYVYGSGFPKSHNISKGIDKAAGQIGLSVQNIKAKLKDAHTKSKLTLSELNEKCGFEASGYFRTSSTWAYVLPDFDKWQKIKFVLGLSDDLDEVFREAEREVVGFQKRGNSVNTDFMSGGNDITAPATAAAKQWDGWGTALKPAHEPMVLARKPLIGTIANNVLTFGTGGLNIDATRVVADGENFDNLVGRPIQKLATRLTDETDDEYKARVLESPGQQAALAKLKELGRFPANFIHDGSDEVVALFPDSKSTSGKKQPNNTNNEVYSGTWNSQPDKIGGFDDSGSAARFFYCAKASKRDRNEGLDGFEAKRDHDGRKDGGVGGDNPRNRTNNAKLNHHPTVKPTTLMQYLVRLVTPPNGIVLDPFMGSGSTGKACAYEGFDFIGIDQSAEYVAIAQARIDFALADKSE